MSPAAPPAPVFVGVPTTTPVAFLLEGELYLERMCILSQEGAGVMATTLPQRGAIIKIAFRLSTADKVTRCSAEVLGKIPTTPAGLALKNRLGDKAPPLIASAGITDSATAIFRLGDLKPPPKEKLEPLALGAVSGFCLRFVDLDPEGRAAVSHHIETSKALAEQLAAQQGRSVAADRPAIAETFHEGDLSKRALDW